MQIEISYEQGQVPVTVFHVKGDITVDTYEQLQQQAQDAIDADTRNLLLDLAKVDYMSSSGVRAIHHIFTLLQDASPGESDDEIRKGIGDGTFKSSHLRLLNPSKRVAQVLKIAGLDMFLEIYTDLQKAIDSF
jgi:anti-anti-sigma regulatory factor